MAAQAASPSPKPRPATPSPNPATNAPHEVDTTPYPAAEANGVAPVYGGSQATPTVGRF